MVALPGNTGVIYIGDVTVAAANGYELAAGAVLDLNAMLGPDLEPTIDLATLYVDAATSGDKVALIYVDLLN